MRGIINVYDLKTARLTPYWLSVSILLHMLKIRLQRVGKKNEPSFRLVLTDSQNATRSGKFLEVLGFHDFRKDGTQFNGEKIKYWISKGAQLSDTVHNLLITNKVIEGKKINVLPKKTVKVEEKKEEPAAAPAPAAAPVAEAPAETPVQA